MSSRVFKAPYVTIDKDNVVNIEVMASSSFVQAVPPVPQEPAEKDDVKESAEATPEKIIEKAKKEAQTIIKNAQTEAQTIKEQMKKDSMAEAKKLSEASKEDGYQRGYQDGAQEAEALKRDARQVYEDAVAQKEEMLNAAEGELLQLMTRILEKLLGDAVHMNPALILHLIRQGLSGATINGDIMIHVSGGDYEAVFQHKDEIVPLVDGSVNLEILKDLSLNEGDCIIETPFGNIDCSLDRQFSSLKQDLYYILENANNERN